MAETLSDKVLEILRCPETGERLQRASVEELQRFPVEFPEGALVTNDGTRAYPIRDGFPILIADEATVAAS